MFTLPASLDEISFEMGGKVNSFVTYLSLETYLNWDITKLSPFLAPPSPPPLAWKLAAMFLMKHTFYGVYKPPPIYFLVGPCLCMYVQIMLNNQLTFNKL